MGIKKIARSNESVKAIAMVVEEALKKKPETPSRRIIGIKTAIVVSVAEKSGGITSAVPSMIEAWVPPPHRNTGIYFQPPHLHCPQEFQ